MPEANVKLTRRRFWCATTQSLASCEWLILWHPVPLQQITFGYELW